MKDDYSVPGYKACRDPDTVGTVGVWSQEHMSDSRLLGQPRLQFAITLVWL